MKIFWTKEKQWQVDVTIAGERIRESGFGKKKDAEDLVVELKNQARTRKHGLERARAQITLERLVKERLLDTAGQASARGVKRILEHFQSCFPAGFLIDEVTTGHIREWTKECKRRGLKATTINRYLGVVAAMFHAAPLMFKELEEDWPGPRFPYERTGRAGRERVISSDESTALLQALRFPGHNQRGRRYQPHTVAARREVADCFELALNTGLRGIEVRSLEWSQVDLREAELHIPGGKRKTGEPHDALLNKRALEILRRLHERRSSRFVFPNPAGTGPRLPIAPVVRRVARELGLRYGRNLADGFSPHDTRHTAATTMLRRGHDLKTVQDVLGHSDRVMTLRYSHSTHASRRAAVEELGRAGGKVENDEREEQRIRLIRPGTRQKVDTGEN